MHTKRIIPCLDVNDGRVVKGINFVNLRDAGDPVEVAAAYDKAGTITDEDIKELFAKKNVIADEDEQTSYEFDEFFAEVVSKWAQDGLTDEKAQLLLNLIDSADGSVDDSEDAMLEELSMTELTGVDISEILKDKFPDYFE